MTSTVPDRLSLSIADIHSFAASAERGRIPHWSATEGLHWIEPAADSARIAETARSSMQELLNLSDDLLLVRADCRTAANDADWSRRCQIDTRGWLYLHFRIDGVSLEETPNGPPTTLGGGCFLVSAFSQPRALMRQALSDVWRTVSIAFRPTFAMRELELPGDRLPNELRRFQAGDPDVDFWYVGSLSGDMRSAVGALLRPTIQTSLRTVYLRAKVAELVCLAVEELHRPEHPETSALKLTHRDMKCLEEARRTLDTGGDPLSLEQLARRVGINRTKLALGFKHLFGVTVGEYDREMRLETARRLLEQPSTSVAYAAAVAGYHDAGSFTKAFRARYGSLPSQLKPAAAHRRRGR
jgi:AraC family transcriptional activator of pyochelin receptor